MRIVKHPAFLAVSLSHFSVDILNGQFAVLLAALSGPLVLTNASVGFIATLYNLVGAATQPVFGWLSDRHGSRWAVAGGVLWMAVFYGLFAIAPGYWPIVCLVLAALGSAAMHPPGANRAAQVGRTFLAGQAATAASLFFLFGQAGLALGPALGGVIMQYLGRPGVVIVAGLAAPVALFAAWKLAPDRDAEADPHTSRPPSAAHNRLGQAQFSILSLVLLVAGLRVWAQVATTTFVSKYLHDQGVASSEYGLVVALFMIGSAVGGVAAGMLADRWGKLRIIALGFALSIGPLYFLPLVAGGPLYVLAAFAGFTNGAPHSILVTMAQAALPGRGSLASGLALGFMFAAGAVGLWLTGLSADVVGLQAALQFSSLISVVCLLLTPLLRRQPGLQPAPVAGSH